jgi:hypothetical protein
MFMNRGSFTLYEYMRGAKNHTLVENEEASAKAV